LDAPPPEADAVLYLERSPQPELAPYLKSLWYCCYPNAPHRREIILPSGHLQIVISLAADHLTDCANDLHAPPRPQSFAVLVGIHSSYQVIDSADLTHLIGLVFHPGGSTPFFSTCTHLFTNLETSLEDIWGNAAPSLRDRLREAPTPAAKFDTFETALLQRLSLAGARTNARNPLVDFALDTLHTAPGATTIAELSRTTGLSTRRLSQLFAEHVGVSPKLYCRIQRFQQAVQELHRGVDVPWAELALACGYYDQSHFANDFRAFSGISPTTYSTATRPWSNHITLD
jgi:AraC-like DNA-binding protein